jgi:hypothetical protein
VGVDEAVGDGAIASVGIAKGVLDGATVSVAPTVTVAMASILRGGLEIAAAGTVSSAGSVGSGVDVGSTAVGAVVATETGVGAAPHPTSAAATTTRNKNAASMGLPCLRTTSWISGGEDRAPTLFEFFIYSTQSSVCTILSRCSLSYKSAMHIKRNSESCK